MDEESVKDDIFIPSTPDKQYLVKPVLMNESTKNNSNAESRVHLSVDLNGIFYLNKSIESDTKAFDSTKISSGDQPTKASDTFNIPAMAHDDECEANVWDKAEGVNLASPVSTPEKEESRKRPNSGIDLNKKPRQKAKKHRPKILDDSQVKRKQKAKVSENFQPKTPVKKSTSKPRANRTNIKKNSSNVVFSDVHIANKACRRALNLDVEVEEASVEDVCNLAEDGNNDLAKVDDVCNNFDKDGDSDIHKYNLIEKVEKNRFAKQYQRRKKRINNGLNLGSSSEPVISTIANKCSLIPTFPEHPVAETTPAIPMIYRKRRVMVRRQKVNRAWGSSKLSSGLMDLFVCTVSWTSASLNWRRKRSEGCTQRRNYASGNIKFVCSQSPSVNLLQHLPKARRANRMKYMQQRRQNNLKSVPQNEIVKLIKECFPQQQKDPIDSFINFLCGHFESLNLNKIYVQQQPVLRVPEENYQQLVVSNQYQVQNVQLCNYGQLVVPTSSTIVPHKDSTKKKKKKRVKVDLDAESERVWTMLMSNIGNTDDKQAEEDPERREYWNRERETTRSRVESFVFILKNFLGDRGFIKWKGSVVDSVVGAFLTQNVTDYLSSTAFMNLAAQFSSRRNSSTRNSSSKAKVSGPPCMSEEAVTIDLVSEKTTLVSEKTTLGEITSVGDNQARESEFIILSQPCASTTNKQVNGEGGSRSEGVTCNEKTVNGSSSQFEGVCRNEKTVNGESNSRSEGVSGNEKTKNDEKVKTDWDNLRKIHSKVTTVRNEENRDAVDWEAVRKATVGEVAELIKDRGMNNVIASKIQAFLKRIVEDHGRIDLEWIRDVPLQDAKDFLLSIYGIGLKSVECVRLLNLHHVAFPVDVNVGRIVVRLGWVPLQPLPGGLEMHLLNDYPSVDTIQKYLYPRLCSFDHRTLYELHYLMITFGKVFCTKIKPSCHSCPLQRQCKHYASLSASKRLALPAPPTGNRTTDLTRARKLCQKSTEPIIEMPPSPKKDELPKREHELPKLKDELPDIEDLFLLDLNNTPHESDNDPDESDEHDEYNDDAPTVMVDGNTYGDNNNNISADMSKSLVVADNRTPVRNDMSLVAENKGTTWSKPIKDRLRTIHLVFELPDDHPILQEIGVDARDPDDPSPYLFTVWQEDLVVDGMPYRKLRSYFSQDSNTMPPEVCLEIVHRSTFNSVEEDRFSSMTGTLMVPVRSANYGNFPLNGTYFQTNEVFADHETSQKPMVIPKFLLYGLPRRLLFCGAQLTPAMKGLPIELIHHAFNQGYFCNRGFNRETRFITELSESFHVKTSNQSKKTKRANGEVKKTPSKQHEGIV